MKGEFIVKIQVSIATTAKNQMVLIYNKDRTFLDERVVSKEILKVMKGENKKYFLAEMKDHYLCLIKEVGEQKW